MKQPGSLAGVTRDFAGSRQSHELLLFQGISPLFPRTLAGLPNRRIYKYPFSYLLPV